MTAISASLQTSPLFSAMDLAEREAMLERLGGKVVSYRKGAFLLREGEPVTALGVLLEGGALIVQEDFWGNRSVMAAVEPGATFGETFACAPGSVSTVSVQASLPSRILYLDLRRALVPADGPCPWRDKLIALLLSDLAEKNLRLNRRLTHMGRRTTRDKVLSYLSLRAKEVGRADFFIPFSRQQLADYLAVDRSGLSAELSRLKAQGLLDYRRNRFVLKRNDL